MKRKLLGVILLVVVGMLKLPLEERATASFREQKLLQRAPELGLRESLGQMGFAASLGGLRSLVASITYLQAYVAWESVDWGRVDSLMSLTTRLQPNEATYWTDAANYMAWDAASNYLRNKDMRSAIRNKLFHDHVRRGVDILEEGLVYLPNNHFLLERLGDIYRDRIKDPRKASACYLTAAANGAKSFYERMGAYQLAETEDRASWEQSYRILKKEYDEHKSVYEQKNMAQSSVLRYLRILEERLGIPPEQRIRTAPPPDVIPRMKLPGLK